MEYKNVSTIVNDHKQEGLSYRKLAEKYGISREQVHRIVMSKDSKPKKPKKIVRAVKVEKPIPDDIGLLQEELRQARVLIELQDFMLDISSKELGIDLRKKHGTRQSK